ncbi:hypothetical protein H8L32_11530 [Undibacterium sp. CY18W]|uniref:Lipoprotein n=1 Tax=Undibacterium hunanense TaxID=2762292 RepID=A0ABR6ZQF1_9BURK|nr:hypothetical protein [Undibacterium hunanense]MBC3918110.1 hypothetical protein [Undibacterium hunanense]
MKEIKLLGLSVVTAMLLAACGGGSGGSAPATVAPVDTSSGPLSKYAGIWNQGCQNHEIETTTITATSGGSALSMAQKIEYYENLNCTGAIVATGTYTSPILVAQHVRTEANATVKMLTGETVASSVDVVNATANGAVVNFVGSAVSSSVVNGKTTWKFVFKDTTITRTIEVSSGSVQGAFMLRNGELFFIQAIGNSNTAFAVDSRFVRG